MAKEFVEEYLGSLEKKVTKKLKDKQKEKEQKVSYKFCYADIEKRICLNTVMQADEPTFVLWDGQKYETNLKEYRLPAGDVIAPPPLADPFYRGIYHNIVVPNQIVENDVTDEEVDRAIQETFLKRWMMLDETYYILVSNYIKFSWIYERFRRTPYLYIYGDWGTGKTELGIKAAALCHYGLVIDDISPAGLARTLHLTNCSVMLDEADYIDGMESEKVRRILRNGYKRYGMYIVAEQEAGRRFTPQTFLIDQPKIIIKRRSSKDDALASRMIPLSMIPRDGEIPRSMRRDDELRHDLLIKEQATSIANLLLRWRWQNIFKQSDPDIVDDMNIRFNDTISPLLKVCSKTERPIIIKFMKEQERGTTIDISDDFRIQIITAIARIYNRNKGFWGPTNRIFLTDIASQCVEDYGSEVSEVEFKKIFSSRNIKRAVKDMAFPTELHANKIFLSNEKLSELIARYIKKYKINDKDNNDPSPEQLLEEAENIAKDEGIQHLL